MSKTTKKTKTQKYKCKWCKSTQTKELSFMADNKWRYWCNKCERAFIITKVD